MEKKMKKTSLLVLSALLIAVAISGCVAPEPEVIVETVEVPGETVVEEVEVPVNNTLVLTSRLWSPPAEQEFIINEIIKPFEEENGVTVNFQILDDVTQLERAEVQQSTGHVTTDVFISYDANMPDWIDAGYVEDLTDLAASWGDRTFMTHVRHERDT